MIKERLEENLAKMLTKSAERFSNKTAVFFADKAISYLELEQMSTKLAQGLINLGVKKDDRVAIFLHNCPEFIISYFAILKSGAVCVTINNMLKEHEVDYILKDSGSEVIITSTAYAKTLKLLQEKYASYFKGVIVTDGLLPETLNFYEIIERSVLKEERTVFNLKADDVATILYTSGTTGEPKGAMLTHKNFLSNVKSCIYAINTHEKDNFICILPMFHSFALTVCILMPLSVGAAIIVLEHIRPFRRVIRNIIKKKVTVFPGIPSVFNLLAYMHIPPIFTSRVLKLIDPLRVCISGAAALPVEVLKAFEEKFRVSLLEGYGLTEAAPVVSLNPLRKIGRPGSVGKPIEDVWVKIVDEQDNRLGPGEKGELLVKGPNVMKGYFKNIPTTQQAIKDGWLYTGDIACIDKEGFIYIVDRKKDMINVRGLNVYPAEIEKVLMQHPKVKEAAVVGVRDKFKGEVPKAFIILKENQKLSSRTIIQYLKENLALFKIPKFVEFKDSFPKTATGKVIKRQLLSNGP